MHTDIYLNILHEEFLLKLKYAFASYITAENGEFPMSRSCLLSTLMKSLLSKLGARKAYTFFFKWFNILEWLYDSNGNYITK